jgi:hypothetical protein
MRLKPWCILSCLIAFCSCKNEQEYTLSNANCIDGYELIAKLRTQSHDSISRFLYGKYTWLKKRTRTRDDRSEIEYKYFPICINSIYGVLTYSARGDTVQPWSSFSSSALSQLLRQATNDTFSLNKRYTLLELNSFIDTLKKDADSISFPRTGKTRNIITLWNGHPRQRTMIIVYLKKSGQVMIELM